MQGLLELKGTIDLNQFWPTKESDGDTVHVVPSGPDAFRFRPHSSVPFKETHAFDGAVVKGRTSSPAIKNGSVTIRLQGIDATELHYRPQAPTLNKKKPTAAQRTKFNAANGNFRQNYGETASVALHDFLKQAGGGTTIDCVVRTAVDQPSDVFDTFGRMIGNIIVTIGGAEQDANLWMAANGWAFPTFYVTMSAQEIGDVTTRIKSAKQAKKGIWKDVSSNLNPFDPTKLFRNHGKPNAATDKGPVIMPKLFRRRSTFASAKSAGMTGNIPFKKYLQLEPDICFLTSEFLANGHPASLQHQLDEFVTAAGTFSVAAGDLVFNELPSHVVGPDGKPVQW
jgi:endonuclease YncB( thermonuclease family)